MMPPRESDKVDQRNGVRTLGNVPLSFDIPFGLLTTRLGFGSGYPNCVSQSVEVHPSPGNFPGWSDQKVTWLILPVVICLSQRLSHACLSINNFILWNCVQLIISVIIYLMVPYYMDTRSNSRANTCVKSWLSREGMYLLDKKPMRPLGGFVVNHSN